LSWKEIFPNKNKFFETKSGILYFGDCLSILKDFPSSSVDLIITSPPYNLGKRHHTGGKYHIPYFDNMPEAEYQKWQIEVLNECYRILKPTGSMMYNHKNRIKNGVQITPYEWLLKTKFIIKQEFDSRSSSCSISRVSTEVIQFCNCTNTNTFQRVNGDTALMSELVGVGFTGA